MQRLARVRISLFVIGAYLCLLPIGCATQESVDALDKRVTALEQRQKTAEAANQERQKELETCVNVDADLAYWNYVELNGKPVAGKPGEYTAPQYVWNEAENQKKEKVEECKLLYGPR